jgi:hypothetical protein
MLLAVRLERLLFRNRVVPSERLECGIASDFLILWIIFASRHRIYGGRWDCAR